MVLVGYVASIIRQKKINLTQVYWVIAIDSFFMSSQVMPALQIGAVNYSQVAHMGLFTTHNQNMPAFITKTT